jgi:hypothetical protein
VWVTEQHSVDTLQHAGASGMSETYGEAVCGSLGAIVRNRVTKLTSNKEDVHYLRSACEEVICLHVAL